MVGWCNNAHTVVIFFILVGRMFLLNYNSDSDGDTFYFDGTKISSEYIEKINIMNNNFSIKRVSIFSIEIVKCKSIYTHVAKASIHKTLNLDVNVKFMHQGANKEINTDISISYILPKCYIVTEGDNQEFIVNCYFQINGLYDTPMYIDDVNLLLNENWCARQIMDDVMIKIGSLFMFNDLPQEMVEVIGDD